MLGAFDAVERGIGLERNAADPGIELSQAARGADERPACAEHGNEVGDASLGLLPDFVRGAVIVGSPVGVVGVLVGIEIFVGMFRGEFTRDANRAVGSIRGIRINNVGAVALENLLALKGDVFGYAECNGKPIRGSEHGIGNTGVAAGGVQQTLSGVKSAAAASFLHDVGGSAIFDRAAGVVPLRLAQKYYAGQVPGACVETQQRRVADAIEQAQAQAGGGLFGLVLGRAFEHWRDFMGALCHNRTATP